MTFLCTKQQSSRMTLIVRAVTDVLFIILAITAPWWLTLPVGFVLLFCLGSYELILAGILMDTMHAADTSFLPGGEFLFTIIFLIGISVLYFIREGVETYVRI